MHHKVKLPASQRQQIFYEDMLLVNLAIREEWLVSEKEGRQPEAGEVLRRFLLINPNRLNWPTARLLCAIGLQLSNLVSDESKARLREIDPELCEWLAANP
jgi:hypothetical protein